MLADNPIPEPDMAAAITQEIVIQGGAMGGLMEGIYKGEQWKMRKLFRKHRKAWTLNGVALHGMDAEPMFILKRLLKVA